MPRALSAIHNLMTSNGASASSHAVPSLCWTILPSSSIYEDTYDYIGSDWMTELGSFFEDRLISNLNPINISLQKFLDQCLTESRA